jgi:hypothetical protein
MDSKITNENLFMNELTHHLSIRYSRPISSVVVSLQHSMCLLFGGSFEPAYIMTITTLPDQVLAVMNKRNVALFQAHLQQALRVSPTRGVVHFVPIAEECLGHGGDTMAPVGGSAIEQGFQGNHHASGNMEGRGSKVSLALLRPLSRSKSLVKSYLVTNPA